MALVVFYEKPGCAGNARQKVLLKAAGHTLVVRDLLAAEWSAATLYPFLEGLPVPEWFNRNAPRVKDGTVVPGSLDAHQALEMLLDDPLLIRRPLLEVGGACRAGFELQAIHDWIGLSIPKAMAGEDFEACRHGIEAASHCAARERQ